MLGDILERVHVTVDHFTALTLFAERGIYSGHMYQPDVNHREMLFDMFVDARPNQANGVTMDSMCDSMVYPTETNSFSGGNQIALFFYGVEKIHADGGVNLWSPSCLSLDYSDLESNKEERHHIMGKIKDVKARLLDLAMFEETLQVFGLARKKTSKSVPLSISEVAEFVSNLGKFRLGTVEELTTFVDNFGMQWLYTVTDEPIEKQLSYFGGLVRAVTPIRVAAYDGRHRFNLCCYFASGFFKPTAVIKMEEPKFNDLFSEKKMFNGETRFPKYEDCALFQKQSLFVTLSKGDVGLEEVLKNLKQSGHAATQNQTLNVTTSVSSMLCEFVQSLIAEAGHLALERFNYGNYWGNKPVNKKQEKLANAVDRNMSTIYEKLLAFIGKSEMYTKLMQGSASITFEEMVKVSRPSRFDSYNPFLAWTDFRPANKVSRQFGIVVCTCKMLCDSLENFGLLRRFLQSRQWVHLQGPIAPRDTHLFGSVEYFDLYIIGGALKAVQEVSKRYLVEKAVLDACRRANKDPQLAFDMKRVNKENVIGWLTIPTFYGSSDLNIEKIKECVDKGIFNDNALGLNTTIITKKLKYAALCTIFRDMMKTICHYGYNPIIQHNSDMNQGLQLYVG